MKIGNIKRARVPSALTKRRLLWIVFGAMAPLFVATLAWYVFPHQLLMVDSGPMKADALVVLGGAGIERPERAAELFKQNAARRIVVCGKGDSLRKERVLESNGVPEKLISLEDASSSTLENAEFSIPILRKLGARRVIIVTSWYHSRRALKCFQHFAPDMEFYSRPSFFAYPMTEWDANGIQTDIRSEYSKTLGYWLFYGISPF